MSLHVHHTAPTQTSTCIQCIQTSMNFLFVSFLEKTVGIVENDQRVTLFSP